MSISVTILKCLEPNEKEQLQFKKKSILKQVFAHLCGENDASRHKMAVVRANHQTITA